MKICMIGGTGLLGSQGAKELIERGHEVRAIALPPLPQGAVLPPEMEISYGNYLEMPIGIVTVGDILDINKGKTPSLLLHSCCGPCSTYVLEYLSKQNYLSRVPVIIISGDYEKETKSRVYNYNIADMLYSHNLLLDI